MKEKQRLDRRNTYTPTDAPQVRGNCDHALNREEQPFYPDEQEGIQAINKKEKICIPAWRHGSA